MIPELAPLVGEFVGIDNARLMLEESRKIASRFDNVAILEMNLEELSKNFSKGTFDFSLCVWNTLGNVKDEVVVLKELVHVTSKSIFITTYLKGTLKQRKNWYKTVGIEIEKIDEESEVFYSKSGLKSKSYSQEDILYLSNQADLKVVETKVLSGVILWSELKNL